MKSYTLLAQSAATGHMLAALGAGILHGAVAAWVMLPDAPTPLPQQQVIQVSMVAPSITAPKPVTPLPQVEKPTPKLPPQKKGMVKAQPKKQPAPKKKVVKKKAEKPRKMVVIQRQQQMTTGRVSQLAKAKHSAITKPVPADYLNNPPPQYPSTARRRKQEGTVMVDVLVSALGRPKGLSIAKSSGVELLDMAALQAIQQWKFVPAKQGSRIVEARVRVPITFRLN